jgi:hypothetical protein
MNPFHLTPVLEAPRKKWLSISSILIGVLLCVTPFIAILVLILSGVGVSTYAGPGNEDAGGWIILFGGAFLGPIFTILFVLASLAGIGLGLFGVFRRKEGVALPLMGVLLNIAAVLGNACLVFYVLGFILSYPK